MGGGVLACERVLMLSMNDLREITVIGKNSD